MKSNLGMGVQAHYRGPRLFDSDATREMVRTNVDWFKKYRDILESDMVHGRRADGRDLDWILHVNPSLDRKGMLCVYNPLDQGLSRIISVSLYYTGIREHATFVHEGENAVEFELDRAFRVQIPVEVARVE